ncbi:MAG: hypothetical protein NZ899_00980 [Thermoguttaceae bacterium]|nr:hypothetical protein [Thermoguttaceae bacterium]MDW8077468.1 hypothetical protein [Thermoguttaceae bacterium]
MLTRWIRFLAVTAASLGLLIAVSSSASAQNVRQRTAGDLFYNYYVAPGPDGIGVELYPAPRPAPPWVGHTYITYEPLMPHEFLYRHQRVYIRVHPDGRRTRTLVWWR